MKILIAYATTEGQTEKIVKFLGSMLSDTGHEVTRHNVRELSGGLSVKDFDRVIIAGSVHSGKHQEELDLFVFANADTLNQMAAMFVSVSLAVAFEDTQSEALKYVDGFRDSTNWKPVHCELVAGAMRHGAYEWFEESKLLEGDLKRHINSELKEDQEFTDWNSLSKAVVGFING